MRTDAAAASLFVLGVVAITFSGDDSRSMFAPVDVPTMTSGQMSATPIYGSSFAPVENMQYVQPSYVQPAYVQPTAYVQPIEYVAAEESWAWAYAGVGALLVGAVAAVRNQGTRVAEPDLEAATGAARVATLAVTGRQFTRRDMAIGLGAAVAAMAQSPAFADEKAAAKTEVKQEGKDASPNEKQIREFGKGYYNPNGENVSASGGQRKANDPNACSTECKKKRLEKYGY